MNDVLLIGACIGFLAVIAFVAKRKYLSKGDKNGSSNTVQPVYSLNPAELQFSPRPLVNKSEQRIWREVEAWRIANVPRLSLSTQVSYGEFLTTPRNDHFRAINTKRADFVLWDDLGMVRAVIEYDGRGHWGDNDHDAQRADHADQVKNRALASAGIPLLRVNSGYRHQDLLANLNQLLADFMSDLAPVQEPRTKSV